MEAVKRVTTGGGKPGGLQVCSLMHTSEPAPRGVRLLQHETSLDIPKFLDTLVSTVSALNRRT